MTPIPLPPQDPEKGFWENLALEGLLRQAEARLAGVTGEGCALVRTGTNPDGTPAIVAVPIPPDARRKRMVRDVHRACVAAGLVDGWARRVGGIAVFGIFGVGLKTLHCEDQMPHVLVRYVAPCCFQMIEAAVRMDATPRDGADMIECLAAVVRRPCPHGAEAA